LCADTTIEEVRTWLSAENEYQSNYYVVAERDGVFKGVISSSNLYSTHHATDEPVGSLIKRAPVFVYHSESLRKAVEVMAMENVDMLPVVSAGSRLVQGVLSYQDILSVYRLRSEEHEVKHPSISLRREGYKLLIRGKKRLMLINKKPGA
jgi:CIC family chloride channel protein